jgi:proline iminopeptidase
MGRPEEIANVVVFLASDEASFGFGDHYLLPSALGLNLAATRKLECPLLIFAGRHDFNVNSQLAADWFAKMEAPSKHFVWFEHSAHLPMTEEPGKYLLALMTYARPLAKPAGNPV